jgi:uncharacterized protein (DUF433 family)
MKERIEVNPNSHFGKPCIAGTRITVQSVLELVREGLSFTTIIKDYYTELKVEDIQACIEYAIDIVAAEEIHISTPAPA